MFRFWERIFTANLASDILVSHPFAKSAKEWGTLSFGLIQIGRKDRHLAECSRLRSMVRIRRIVSEWSHHAVRFGLVGDPWHLRGIDARAWRATFVA